MTARAARLWLTLLVLGSIAVRSALAGRMPGPWIMVDELIYSELAKSLAAGGDLLVRGVSSTGYGFVYPALIAPAWRAYPAVPDAYAAAKVINSVVMSLAAVPAYLLAHRVLDRRGSLVVAALSLVIPSMLYTGTLMTENAFYPLFLVGCLALVATLERPTPLRQVLLLVVCAACFITRAQAIALFGAAIVAPAVHGLIERDLRPRLRSFSVLYGIVGAGAVLALAGTVLRGRSPLSLLGAYRAAADSDYSVADTARYVLWHIAELDLYVGIAAFAALLALWLAPRAASAYAAATLPVAVLLVVEVAVFASRQSFRIEERNDFYLAPLALIPLVGLATGQLRVGRRALLAAAAAAAVLPALIPFGRFVNSSAVSDTLALLPWWWIQDQGIPFGPLRLVALAVGVAVCAALAFGSRTVAAGLVAATFVYFVLASVVAENGRHGVRQASAGGLFAGIRKAHPDWIDRRVGRAADVSFLWHYAGETRPLWNNEFFNRSVGTVYTLDGPDPADGGLPETPVRLRGDGTLVDAHGRAPRVAYAVSYTDLLGRVLARDEGMGLALYEVHGPMQVVTDVRGLYPNDTWAQRRVRYRRLRCRGGVLAVRVGTDEHLFTRDQVVRVRQDGRATQTFRVPPTEQRTLQVPLHPNAAGVCAVRFVASRAIVPGNGDTRPLALHYYSFTYLGR